MVQEFDITRKKVNIFKIRSMYCFKQYFDDRELFKELSDYYVERSFRFEIKTAGERNKIMKLLWSRGFEPVLVKDFNEFMVKIDRYKKYGDILKNSIEHKEMGNDSIFVIKDMLSVKQAIEQGAERYYGEIDVEWSGL